ncbi:MAG: hypothetical protein ABIG10_03900 [bacterium]
MQLQNNKKRFGFFIITLGLVLIGAIIYFIFFHDFSGKESGVSTEIEEAKDMPERKQNVKTPEGEEVLNLTPSLTQEELYHEDVRQLASSFTERLGSWSNQADSSNLVDLKLFMTKQMQDWADENIISNRIGLDYEEYYGISTKAVTSEVQSKSDDFASVMVHTKRTEIKQGKTRVFNQDILIKLAKPGKSWKVDGAFWQ